MRTLITGDAGYVLTDDDMAWLGMFYVSILASNSSPLGRSARQWACRMEIPTLDITGLARVLNGGPIESFIDRIVVFSRNASPVDEDIKSIASRYKRTQFMRLR